MSPWYSQSQIKKIIVIALIGASFAILNFVLSGKNNEHAQEQSQPQREARLKVAATIAPLADIVRTIGGEDVSVELLLPPGNKLEALQTVYSSPRLNDIVAIFAVGHGLDNQNIPDSLSPKVTVVDRNINVLLEEGSTGNPYYWLSLRNAALIASTVVDVLSELDPAASAGYASRRDEFAGRLQLFDLTTQKLMQDSKRKHLAVYGYDWQYFADDYGLIIVHQQAPIDGSMAEEQKNDIVQAIRDYGITTIFSDISLSPALLLPILEEENIAIANLDVFGGAEEGANYLQLMSYNARTIFEGLTAPNEL